MLRTAEIERLKKQLQRNRVHKHTSTLTQACSHEQGCPCVHYSFLYLYQDLQEDVFPKLTASIKKKKWSPFSLELVIFVSSNDHVQVVQARSVPSEAPDGRTAVAPFISN